MRRLMTIRPRHIENCDWDCNQRLPHRDRIGSRGPYNSSECPKCRGLSAIGGRITRGSNIMIATGSFVPNLGDKIEI